VESEKFAHSEEVGGKNHRDIGGRDGRSNGGAGEEKEDHESFRQQSLESQPAARNWRSQLVQKDASGKTETDRTAHKLFKGKLAKKRGGVRPESNKKICRRMI